MRKKRGNSKLKISEQVGLREEMNVKMDILREERGERREERGERREERGERREERAKREQEKWEKLIGRDLAKICDWCTPVREKTIFLSQQYSFSYRRRKL
jgi:hypothetical protein